MLAKKIYISIGRKHYRPVYPHICINLELMIFSCSERVYLIKIKKVFHQFEILSHLLL